MNANIIPNRPALALALLAIAALLGAARAEAAALVDISAEPYPTAGRIDYTLYTGRFVGQTARGAFRVPFQIVAPTSPRRGNGTVVFEAPHFVFGPAARNTVLGPDILFARGFSHASVDYSNEVGAFLDPAADDVVIADAATVPGAPPFPRDVGILKQFVELLDSDPEAQRMLGKVERRYAYGLSQSAEALFELFYGPGGEGLFDLTVLQVPLWRPTFARPDVLAALPLEFTPIDGIGKVMIVSSEGDQLFTPSAQFRRAAGLDDWRVYEVAGAPHLPLAGPAGPGAELNSLDPEPVVRGVFVRGDRWVRTRGAALPAPTTLLAADTAAPDGIARDADGNALGGVRLPDVEVGRRHYIASFPPIEVLPGLAGLVGLQIDLACVPRPGSGSDAPRFETSLDYRIPARRQVFRLLVDGWLYPKDAIDLFRSIANTDIGSCDPA